MPRLQPGASKSAMRFLRNTYYEMVVETKQEYRNILSSICSGHEKFGEYQGTYWMIAACFGIDVADGMVRKVEKEFDEQKIGEIADRVARQNYERACILSGKEPVSEEVINAFWKGK